jgi:dolichol-phosphate mannosyltransferase
MLEEPLRRPATLFGLCAVIADFGLLRLLDRAGCAVTTAHSASFLVVLLGVFLLFSRIAAKYPQQGRQGASGRSRMYGQVLLVLLAMLFLRGGLFALLLAQFSLSHPLVIGIEALSVTVTWLLMVLVLPEDSSVRFTLYRNRAGIFMIVAYSVLLRLVYLGGAELIQEEAYYWNYAQHPALGYLDHPPFVAWLITFGTGIFGDNEFGVRIGAYACWLGTAWFAWQYTRMLFTSRVALGSLLFVSVLPVFFGTGLLMTPDAPLITFWAGSLYFLYRALVQGRRYCWIGAGICLGLGLLSKYTIVLLGPAVVAYMLIEPRARKWFFSPLPYLAALIAVTLFLPVIIWNYQHDWASFLFQSQRRIADVTEFSFHVLIVSIMGLLTPVGMWAVFASVLPQQVTLFKQRWREADGAANYRFMVIMAAVPLSVFIFFSLFKQVKFSWTGPLWLAVLPLLALVVMERGCDKVKQLAMIRRAWPGTIVFFMLFYGCFLHSFALGLPGVPLFGEPFLIGWQDLAARLEQKIADIERETGVKPIVAGMDRYRTASGLAFYRNMIATGSDAAQRRDLLGETTSRNLFDLDGLMYGYWTHPQAWAGRSVILISYNKRHLRPERLLPFAREIHDVEEFHYRKLGKPAGPIYYRVLTGYTPSPDDTGGVCLPENGKKRE